MKEIEFPKDPLKLLIYLTTPKNHRRLSGNPKKNYRLKLVHLFIYVINNGVKPSNNLIDIIKMLKLNLQIPEIFDIEYDSETLNSGYYGKLLQEHHFHNLDITDEEFKTKLVHFFNEKLISVNDGRRFWQAKEFEKFFSIEDFFKEKNPSIKNYHWIDFNIVSGLIPTLPDFIAYGDMINNWNMLIRKRKYYLKLRAIEDNYEKRMIEYEIFTLQRFGYSACVTFFETYLLYLFYNLKSENTFIENKKVSDLYEKKYRSITDEMILEELIKPIYIETAEKERFDELNRKYKKINKIRNAIVHTSAFKDESQDRATMELYFGNDLNFTDLKNSYFLVIEFTLFIESLLSEEDKILYWWDVFPEPVFDLENELSIINRQRFI